MTIVMMIQLNFTNLFIINFKFDLKEYTYLT